MMVQSVSGIEITEQWKKDTCISVRMYNDWFMQFAPKTYIDEKVKAEASIDDALKKTCNFLKLNHEILQDNPKTIFFDADGNYPASSWRQVGWIG